MVTLYRSIASLILLVIMTGCSLIAAKTIQDGAPNRPIDVTSIPDAIPKIEPITRAGNPPVYTVLGKQYKLMSSSNGYIQRGIASWYGTKFHGRKTSNGERYDMYAMTAAHKTLPIPAYLSVTNLQNQRTIIVRVNDRGPFHENRIIDLSYSAAAKLGILKTGTGFVEIEAINPTLKKSPVHTQSSLQKQKNLNEVYLQVGSFLLKNNATRLLQKIHRQKLSAARIQTIYAGETVVHRVQVGPLKSAEEVDKLVLQLRPLGVTKTQLITR